MRPKATAWLLLLALAVLSGCGGPTGDEDKIVAAVIRYVEAVTGGDGDTVCEVLTGKPLSDARENGVCGLKGGIRRKLNTKLEVADIRIAGGRADAEMRQGRSVAAVSLVKRGDEWLIDGLELERSEFRIPSASMEPTIRRDARVLVDATAYSALPVQRGDIVVFSGPKDTDRCPNPDAGGGTRRMCDRAADSFPDDQRLIMRVVGVGGDRLAMSSGRLTVNGVAETGAGAAGCDDESVCAFPEEITVPRETIFLLGDNRAESNDSRFFGPVPVSAIVGRVEQPG